jgi:acetyl esterase
VKTQVQGARAAGAVDEKGRPLFLRDAHPKAHGCVKADFTIRLDTGRFLARDFMKFGWNIYAPDAKLRKEAYVAPLQASIEQLRGLPPALVQTAENDPLRDEGEAYAQKLDQAGVEVITTRYLGQIHDFGLLNALQNISSTQESLRQASEALEKYLNQ